MYTVLEKSAAFVCVIILGNFLKKKNILRKEDFRVLSTLLLKVTVPCAVINNFSSMSLETSLLTICLIGMGLNVATLFLGYLLNIRKTAAERSFDMINLSGFNIGSFAMPFAQSFLGPSGVIAASLFDTGNSVMCTGLNFTAAGFVKDGEGSGHRISGKKILRDLFSSVPFDTYIIMTAVAMLHIPVPSFVVTFTSIGAGANALVAMLMIGVGMDLAVNREKLGHALRIVGIRIVFSVMAAVILYHLPFFSHGIRQGMTLVCLAPVSALTPAFSERLGLDYELASTINSISILTAVIMIVTALMIIL